ncbi:MAG: flagellar hook-basal body complex protein FliE [Bradymonadia bacterium]
MSGLMFPDMRGVGAAVSGVAGARVNSGVNGALNNVVGARFNGGVGPASINPGSTGKPFAEFLSEQIDTVNQAQIDADTAVAAVATGKSKNLHEMMIALEKADISLKALTKVRSKVIEAYQEVMRMNL